MSQLPVGAGEGGEDGAGEGSGDGAGEGAGEGSGDGAGEGSGDGAGVGLPDWAVGGEDGAGVGAGDGSGDGSWVGGSVGGIGVTENSNLISFMSSQSVGVPVAGFVALAVDSAQYSVSPHLSISSVTVASRHSSVSRQTSSIPVRRSVTVVSFMTKSHS